MPRFASMDENLALGGHLNGLAVVRVANALEEFDLAVPFLPVFHNLGGLMHLHMGATCVCLGQ